jgi:histidyl-tRNA synthetase
MPIETVRGVRDYGPTDAIALKQTISTVEEIFKRFGFVPIETPSIESLETLNAKAYGQESRKEMYVIEGGKEGLLYDLTVPLARFIAMNKDLPLPFKRYQIGKAWRRDEPQKMRNREFIQADIDIIGSTDNLSEAEVIAATALAIEALGISQYTINLNSRIFLNAILNTFGVQEDKHLAAIRAIDKMEKTSHEDVVAMLTALGMDGRKAEDLINFVSEDLEIDKKLQKLVTNAPDTKAEAERMGNLISLLDGYHLAGSVKLNFSLARGLDYYTGTIFEFVAYEKNKPLPSFAGGGRYDKLIGLYTKMNVPAVGCSIGISRLFEVVKADTFKRTYANAYVAWIGAENIPYAVNAATMLRARGIYAEMNVKDRSISKQLEYANSLKIKYAVIIGNAEKADNKVRLRDMVNGNEEMLNIEEAIEKIKGHLDGKERT